MSDTKDPQTRFNHLFSSPLTAMRGAIDLLRRPRRTADDPTTRELLETLDRSCTRLRAAVEVLLTHSQFDGEQVEMLAPLRAFEAILQQPTSAASRVVGAPAPRTSVEAAPATSAEPVPSTRPPAVTGKVLLIEDSSTYRGVLHMVLAGAGYEVLEAVNGIQGVDLAREHHPDLILLDLELPLLSGKQVAQVLREDPETKAIPLIYLSGYNRLLAQLPPHVDALPKTAAPTALLHIVQQTLAASQARAEQPPIILTVDDDPDILSVLHAALQEDSYRVVSAETGAEALMHTQKQVFDLIILDVLLPDIDGFSVLGALRARPETALTPIILLSARDSAAEKVQGLQLGADDYVTKPFSPDELSARVRATIRRRELEGGANPSTRLPGNIAIERTIRRRIENNLPFAVCYTDLDNFKAYNDTYGFLKGDAVIHQTAHVLLAAVEQHGNQDDFVGHIGGDDFVVITTPDRAERVCAHAITAFDSLAPLFYDAATRARGFIDACDRQGQPTRFPFVSISIAIVSNAQQSILHLAEVAQRSIDLKKRAKEIAGSVYVSEDEGRGAEVG
jgi:diguanylate cyclase (GGDEF)-like protein